MGGRSLSWKPHPIGWKKVNTSESGIVWPSAHEVPQTHMLEGTKGDICPACPDREGLCRRGWVGVVLGVGVGVHIP